MRGLEVRGRVVGERDRQVGLCRRRRAGPPRPAAARSRNMSWASARRDPGRRITRLPRATRWPAMSTESVPGDTDASASGSHQGTDGSYGRRAERLGSGTKASRPKASGSAAAGRRSPEATGRSDRIVPCSRSMVGASIASTRSISAAARGSVARAAAFSCVGERERAQGEDLVDLGAVVELARALRRELRVVGQDDRGGQHDLAAVARAGQHRPAAGVLARGRRPAAPTPAGRSSRGTPAGHA